jgi:DMSO/TMAO reductase YedYZ molybdopterin-dependent catalytic subunit
MLETAGASAALAASGALAAQAAGLNLDPALPAGTRAEATLEALPGKKPLIKLAYRPPNYETPIEYFREPVTPNDVFFVRYHLSDIPEVDAKTWRLMVGGDAAEGAANFTLDELKALPAVEVVAVNQCSGNRRGLFQPHVPGVQWGYGAMGCAHWKGARLKDVLAKAGLKKDMVEVVLEGADGPAVETTPDFAKSLPAWKALEDTTLVAYEMNGAPLPHFNGFPARVIVPGWTGTYWMKHLTALRAVTRPFQGFWMKSAYRIPNGLFPLVRNFDSQETAANTPITEMVVNSLITSHADGARVKAGTKIAIGGIAWDAGYGIRTVEISSDSGKTWTTATLGEDLGRFAFHPFRFDFTPRGKGQHTVIARASNRIGQTQTAALIHYPPGYHHNVMHRITLNAG